MIYTVTFNPALDYVVKTENFALGKLNRCFGEAVYCGGKGINVSTLLTRLGVPNTALGFVAGFTGEKLCLELDRQGVLQDFIHLKNGFSRINVKIHSAQETEINAQGPEIDRDALNCFFEKLDQIKEDDALVLSGSIPKALPEDIYGQILERVRPRNVLCVVDAAGAPLRCALEYCPFLIKPNLFELEQLCGKVTNTDDIVSAAKRLQTLGAQNVLVSLGGQGAVLVTKDSQTLHMSAFEGHAVNTVGAGDSMIAGFLFKWFETKDYAASFRFAVAAGSATAFSEELASKELIEKLYAAK